MGQEDKQYPPMDWFEKPKATFEDRQNYISWIWLDKAEHCGVDEGYISYAVFLDSQFKSKPVDEKSLEKRRKERIEDNEKFEVEINRRRQLIKDNLKCPKCRTDIKLSFTEYRECSCCRTSYVLHGTSVLRKGM